MIDPSTLRAAYDAVRRDLLAQRTLAGHWIGELSSSALATATATSALAIVARHTSDKLRQGACRQLAARGVEWLVRHQNADGGWGDTDKSFSNISTTMLVRAALELAGVAAEHRDLLARAAAYVEGEGGLPALRQRYGPDKTFAVPILANCALAGLVPWREVDPLPFEIACLPFGLLRFMRLPVVSYALPALVAIGQVRYFHRWPRNPIALFVRGLAVRPSLKRLGQMQPASGGYLEAIPLTSFVVMSLASTRRADHLVVRRGVEFLLATVRDDGAWPIDSNLATWNTTLATSALAAATGDVGALGGVDWLLSCQHRQVHPFTQALPGGWGWSDASGAVPDVDDTSAALLALAVFLRSSPGIKAERIRVAAAEGFRWLLDLQNDDGGWPTFCRGWGTMPFDRSGSDLTAHALRALHAWRETVEDPRTDAAILRGLDYLSREQAADGSWAPLWFGNQYHPHEENPVYGTARVLLAYRDLNLLASRPAQAGLRWLAASHNGDGGWGGDGATQSSVEETAVALEALLSDPAETSRQIAIREGLRWLTGAIAAGRHRDPTPIGFYFAKLWYYERMYPLVFAVSALGQASRETAK